ncbi:MAG: hypothetical protein J0M07_00020 [Anaerolineae bacterium]|nr:hypothetical protein [Anaerolineae bacterium]
MQRAAVPAIALMNRLKYLQKFLLISVLFAVPLVIVMSQYLVNVAHDIEFSAKEQLGLDYNEPLIDLLAVTQLHDALMSAALNGSTLFEADIATVRETISTRIAAVDAVDAELGADLQVNEAWAAIKATWDDLMLALPTLTAAESKTQHLWLNNQLLALITQVGNNSNLILDPDIDSYYLMNSVITTLPQTMEYFSQLRSDGTAALAKGALMPSDVTRLTILSGLAQSALDENIRSYAYTFAANPAIEAQLAEIAAANEQNLESFLNVLNTTLLTADAARQDGEILTSFVAISTQALDSSFGLYSAVANSLDELLEKRVDGIEQGRAFVVVVTLITLVATAYVFAGFYLSVKQTIAALDKASERIVKNQIPGDLVLQSRDELAQAAVAFNNVAKGLDLARREAVEATRMKDLFLATMSHELRTPLNAMIGFLHLMLYSGQLDDDNTHMAERSLANTNRLLTLINNILDLSRIATGGLEIVPTPLALRHISAGLFNDLKPLAQEKDLRLELSVDPTIPDSINHDETRLSQIVINLVSNAIKFTDKGTIDLMFKRHDERLVIQVKDTGVGIPQSKQQLIFDDFFQVDSTSTRKQQGAGLGLAIVKRLVLLMNGTINLVSDVGQGSTFTVELPLNLPHYEPTDRRKRAEFVFADSLNAQPALDAQGSTSK